MPVRLTAAPVAARTDHRARPHGDLTFLGAAVTGFGAIDDDGDGGPR